MKYLIFLLINKFMKKIRFYSLRNSEIGKFVKINSGTQLVNSNFGDYSYCGYDCNFINVKIGKFCCISDNVIIGGATHPLHFVSISSVFLSHKDSSQIKLGNLNYLPQEFTYIGHDVWIGNRVSIKSGINIGTGAVIGMGSVVTKNVPDYAIVAGNPAKIIKYRFEDPLRYQLLESKWWDIDEIKLKKLSIYFDDPIKFLEELKK
ncbi:CatB-related O-acetyltransferase [Acinetobacter sp. ANC 3791]|uniref:CatB-related O-acetyltransferase n=1 Tax=Acinetobacter sp. ANC 3791 TaxID=2529836 RepID=UPI00103A1679|nr:CatB-related O-acetyltransferase [Acinetobacter sp. ANC 3791]TCB81318.1 CatB-related O-acetyltransferase [Acinetobacter sp. ANC 3791]